MSSEEARQIVADGLERRKEEQRQRDAELEKQERILRIKINNNHTVKTYSEAQKEKMEQEQKMEAIRKNREAWAKERAARVARDMAAEEAINKYGIACLAILLVSAITRLNIFVMISLALGLAVFPAAYIYRLYYPITEDDG